MQLSPPKYARSGSEANRRADVFIVSGLPAVQPEPGPFASRAQFPEAWRNLVHIELSALEQRVASVLQGFDAQGNHRTATAVDNASAEWLTDQVRQLAIAGSMINSIPVDRR